MKAPGNVGPMPSAMGKILRRFIAVVFSNTSMTGRLCMCRAMRQCTTSGAACCGHRHAVPARNVATRPSGNVFLNDSFAPCSVCGEDTVRHETHIAPRARVLMPTKRGSYRSSSAFAAARAVERRDMRAERHKSLTRAQSCLTTAPYARSTRQCRHLRRNRRPESRRTGQQRSNRTEGDRRCHRTIRRSREVHSPGTERVAIATHRRV